MLKVFRLLAAATVLAGLLGGSAPASANSCSSQLVIFSGRQERGQNVGFVNSNAAVCIVTEGSADDVYDGRIINPGSTLISVRYTTDFGADFPALDILVDGLGVDNQIVPATRAATTTGSFVYDTARVAIDPEATGEITASLLDPETGEALDTVTFHTVV